MMIYIFLLLQSLSVFADPPVGSAPWRNVQNDLVTYEELISYDTFARDNYSESRLAKPPKKAMLNVFRRFRTKVKEIANEFKVDPRLLVGMITTEHTLNVQIDDVIMEGAQRSKIKADGSMEKFEISYGFGQIYEEAALAAEPIVARVRGREVMDMDQVRQNLLTLDGALSYAAATVVAITETYQRYGMDISHRPGIIASLYNLGKYEEFAQTTKAENRDARINFFGFYLLTNWSEFHDVIYGELKNNLVIYQQGQDDLIPAADCEFAKCLYATTLGGGTIEADFYKGVFSAPEPIRLYYAPNRCSTSQLYGDRTSEEVKKFMESDVRAISGKMYTGAFEVLQTALGCEVDDWSLVRFSDTGEVGWVAHEELFKGLDYLYVPQLCTPDYQKCRTDMEGVIRSTAEKIDPRYRGRVYIKKDETLDSVLKVSVLGVLALQDYYYLDTSRAEPWCTEEDKIRKEIVYEEESYKNLRQNRDQFVGYSTFEEYLQSVTEEIKRRNEKRLAKQQTKVDPFSELGTYLSREQAEDMHRVVIDYVKAKMFISIQKFMLPEVVLGQMYLDGVLKLRTDCQQGCYVSFSQEELLVQIDRRWVLLLDPERGIDALSSLQSLTTRYLSDIRNNKEASLSSEVQPFVAKGIYNVPKVIGNAWIRDDYFFNQGVWSVEVNNGGQSEERQTLEFDIAREEITFSRLSTEKKIELFNRSCKKVRAELPRVGQKWDEYVAELLKLKSEEQEWVFIAVGDSFLSLFAYCDLYQLAEDPSQKEKIEYPNALKEILSRSYLFGSQVSPLVLISGKMDKSEIETIFLSLIEKKYNKNRWKKDLQYRKESFAESRDSLLRRQEQRDFMRKGPLGRCGYHVINTTQLIQQIAKSECVKQILLPHQKPIRVGNASLGQLVTSVVHPLIQALDREGVSWREYNFGDDRESFGIVLKEECRENQ